MNCKPSSIIRRFINSFPIGFDRWFWLFPDRTAPFHVLSRSIDGMCTSSVEPCTCHSRSNIDSWPRSVTQRYHRAIRSDHQYHLSCTQPGKFVLREDNWANERRVQSAAASIYTENVLRKACDIPSDSELASLFKLIDRIKRDETITNANSGLVYRTINDRLKNYSVG